MPRIWDPPAFYNSFGGRGKRKRNSGDEDNSLQVALIAYIEQDDQDARSFVLECANELILRYCRRTWGNTCRSDEIYFEARARIIEVLDNNKYDPRRSAKFSTFVCGVTNIVALQHDQQEKKHQHISYEEWENTSPHDVNKDPDALRHKIWEQNDALNGQATQQNALDASVSVDELLRAYPWEEDQRKVIEALKISDTKTEAQQRLGKDSKWLDRRLQKLRKIFEHYLPALFICCFLVSLFKHSGDSRPGLTIFPHKSRFNPDDLGGKR